MHPHPALPRSKPRFGRCALFVAGFAAVWIARAASAAEGVTDWPHWHGPAGDGHASPSAPVPDTLPVELKPAWKIAVGGGHSSPVVAGDAVVYLDESGDAEVAHRVDARTGREVWRAAIGPRNEDEWGAGPRSTAAIDGDRVYALSSSGEFHCLQLKDGRAVWSGSFEKDFGVKFLGGKANEGTATRRGNNGSPLVDGADVVFPVGATNGATLACFDKLDGRVKWKVGDDEAAYSTPVVATLAGIRQVVYLSADALMGVERATGRLLWREPLKTAAKRHAATPVISGDIVVVNSHTFGTLGFRVVRDGGGCRVERAWANAALKTNLATPVALGGFLYNLGANKDYVCLDAQSGALRWSQTGFGQGRKDYASTLAFKDRLLVLNEDGTLVLMRAKPAGYDEIARLQLCGNTWSFPAYAGGRLYYRDARQLGCVELAGAR